MIVYLDASALVKRYVSEAGSPEVAGLIKQAAAVGTAIISRAEVAAALARAARRKLLTRSEAASALRVFSAEWDNLVRLQMTEILVSRASTLVWDHDLRGYAAVHLAAALFWHEMLGEPITVATYDKQLWGATSEAGLIAWPASLP